MAGPGGEVTPKEDIFTTPMLSEDEEDDFSTLAMNKARRRKKLTAKRNKDFSQENDSILLSALAK